MFLDSTMTVRIGLLVPPANISMEREFFLSLPTDITVGHRPYVPIPPTRRSPRFENWWTTLR